MANDSFLVIPIKVDALFLDSETMVVSARTDFSKLPFNNGKEDMNTEFAYVSENFLSQPFQNNNFLLQPGVHLHWALPDAFTNGKIISKEDKKDIKHYEVPDRWIVNRKKQQPIVTNNEPIYTLEKSWVVESNYLHPEGRDNKYHAIAYPVNEKETSGQPFRFMGRSFVLFDAGKTNSAPLFPLNPAIPEYLESLTAVGYGEPSFAVFYPNCHSVFGFHDGDIKKSDDLPNYQYEVMGWFSDKNKDPLNNIWNASSALNFDGIDDFIEVTIPALPNGNSPRTMEAWIKTTQKSTGTIMTWGNSGKNERCSLLVNESKLYFNGQENNLSSFTNVNTGNWHHVALTFDGDTIQLYLDGSKGANLKTTLNTSGNILRIGNGSSPKDSEFFDGSISGIRIWDIARTWDEIGKDMNNDIDPKKHGPIVYYKFSDGEAGAENPNNKILNDFSSNNNHGILNNFKLSGESSNWIIGPQPNFKFIQDTLKQNFKFNLASAAISFTNENLPRLSLCYTRTVFQQAEKNNEAGTIDITVGNTGTEAMSAWLNAKLNGVDNQVEEQLEALQMLAKVAGKKLDIGPAFIEAFHEKGFSSVDGGIIWNLKITDVQNEINENVDNDKKPGKPSKGISITLPDIFAEQLNDLNILQQQLDRANDELTSLQKQLYADWCKYMIAAYHPDIEKGLPQKDDVRFFIEAYSFPSIKNKQEYTSLKKKELFECSETINFLCSLFNTSGTDQQLYSKNSSVPHKKITSLFYRNEPVSTTVPIVISADPALNNIHVKKLYGGEDVISIDGISNFNSISCWINIDGVQPAEGNLVSLNDYSGNLISETTINANNTGSFWQNMYINGVNIDPYETIKWKDIPKDQWMHIYLEGKYNINAPCTINIMQSLNGKVAAARVFNAALTPMELLYDINMLGLKKMNLACDKGPRYWQPTEPVILISGDMAKPSERYGFDGELNCYYLNTLSSFDIASLKTAQNYLQKALKQRNSADIKKYSTDVSSQLMLSYKEKSDLAFDKNSPIAQISFNPTFKPVSINSWNPLFLEWRIGITPVADSANAANYTIPEGFITDNFILADDKPDLVSKKNLNYDSIKIFSGTSILTPHAKNRLMHVIEKYLQNLHEDNNDWGLFIKNNPSLNIDGPFVNPFCDEDNTVTQTTLVNYYNVHKDIFEKKTDTISVALSAYKKLCDNNFLSQSLNGFNSALQMLHQTFQLPIADPIGFNDDQGFAANVKVHVQGETKYAPLPLFEFDPIRSGTIIIQELNLIDSFGQIEKIKSVADSTMLFAKTLKDGSLPPRIAQPARINFRWLSANHEDVEMNEQPASSPVCGWLVADNIDDNILVFDQEGYAVGSVNKDAPKWRSAPGTSHPIEIAQLPNQHLIDTIRRLLEISDLASFIELLEGTLDQIDPENFTQHTDLSILISKPIAIVRASVGLEVKGNYAINQSWEAFESDMNKAFMQEDTATHTRETNGWEKIKFPVRIGEHGQLNDGIIGFWRDDESNIFHSPVSVADNDLGTDLAANINTSGYDAAKPAISLSSADDNISMTLLMDPRGKAHATCGALPSKIISIPDDQYKPSLRNMSFTFYTRPLLMPVGKIAISLPNESGYNWSWLTQSGNKWVEIATTGIVNKEDFQNAFKNGDAIWNEMIVKGWIEETVNNKARVIPTTQRKDPEPKPLLITQVDKIQALLDAGHIIDADTQAQLHGSTEIKEGWLKLTPIN